MLPATNRSDAAGSRNGRFTAERGVYHVARFPQPVAMPTKDGSHAIRFRSASIPFGHALPLDGFAVGAVGSRRMTPRDGRTGAALARRLAQHGSSLGRRTPATVRKRHSQAAFRRFAMSWDVLCRRHSARRHHRAGVDCRRSNRNGSSRSRVTVTFTGGATPP